MLDLPVSYTETVLFQAGMWQLKQGNFDPLDKVGIDTSALLPFYYSFNLYRFSQFNSNSLNLCLVSGGMT